VATQGRLGRVPDEDPAAADDDVVRESLVMETALNDAAGEGSRHTKDGSETRIVVRVVATSSSLAGFIRRELASEASTQVFEQGPGPVPELVVHVGPTPRM
jgi:hypothetical protein